MVPCKLESGFPIVCKKDSVTIIPPLKYVWLVLAGNIGRRDDEQYTLVVT